IPATTSTSRTTPAAAYLPSSIINKRKWAVKKCEIYFFTARFLAFTVTNAYLLIFSWLQRSYKF
ncbi:hypothetical protein, partial [Acidaminococcus massiliensis]|uniref:hypothetical protein n=1 Tax=Acidaminococcus massiliensis TaxID=1852375 RepID=UPI0022E10546